MSDVFDSEKTILPLADDPILSSARDYVLSKSSYVTKKLFLNDKFSLPNSNDILRHITHVPTRNMFSRRTRCHHIRHLVGPHHRHSIQTIGKNVHPICSHITFQIASCSINLFRFLGNGKFGKHCLSPRISHSL